MRLLTITTILAAVVLAVTGNVMATTYVETFDDGSASWYATTIDNGGHNKISRVKWSKTGGNPDGYISGKLGTKSNRLYALTPKDVNVYGDMTGLTLTTDYKVDGKVTGPAKEMTVRFYVGSEADGSKYFVTNDTYSWDPNMDTSWTTHQVELIADNFLLWPNQDSGDITFDDVIANLDDIGLVFTGAASDFKCSKSLGFSGKGIISIDNFGTVPEPATLCLLGLGAVGIIVRKRR